MLIRHLILPGDTDGEGNVSVMLYPSGEIIRRPPYVADITWAEFAGDGNKPPGCPTAQPYWSCNTGGNIVMDRHLENLAKDYESRQNSHR